jgi:hypothetical protein
MSTTLVPFVIYQRIQCPPQPFQIDAAVNRCDLFDFAFSLDVGPHFRHLLVVFSDIFGICL